jgi:hypothetical protein
MFYSQESIHNFLINLRTIVPTEKLEHIVDDIKNYIEVLESHAPRLYRCEACGDWITEKELRIDTEATYLCELCYTECLEPAETQSETE